MNLREFLCSMRPAKRKAFAEKCGTTVNYLAQLQYGCKRPGPAMARALHESSDHQVPLESMRPDIWGQESGNGEKLTRS